MVKFNYLLFIFIYSCNPKLYEIEKDPYGEPILNEKTQYSFSEKPSNEDLIKIDTTAYYVQTNDNNIELENPKIIIFHNDGYFKTASVKYFGKFDKHRNKKSIYYGGKYKINNNEILIEYFVPASPSVKRFIKKVVQGKIQENGNKILFDFGEYIEIIEKKDSL
ncbi:hypothetical protein [Empedobacter brevis]|uniref:hypothetical protein n=1 Tax=Empedobacter brevis TaxID=247 RepID=UPI001330C510|nr:hypothetical protein [Empedobacter brevis]